MQHSISGVILCGGRSARMGRAKALLPWQGRPLVSHMVSRLGSLLEEVVVVSSAGLRLPELPARIVVDRTPHLGPLAGIREALHVISGASAFVTSIDAPFVDASLIDVLSAAGRTAAFEVDGWIEPFPAVYARELASRADRLLNDGRRRPLHLLEAAGFERLDGSSWAAQGVFDNFNTPEQYLGAVTRLQPEATVTLTLSGAAAKARGQKQVTIPVGTLAQVLGTLEPHIRLVVGERISPAVQVILGTEIVDNLQMPVGAGECLQVVDAPQVDAIRKGARP